MLCFVVVMQSFIMNSHEVFIHIHQGCFDGTGAIVRLPQWQWSKPDGYGKISQCITTTKHSKAKTVCIFLGIYCRYGNSVTWVKTTQLSLKLLAIKSFNATISNEKSPIEISTDMAMNWCVTVADSVTVVKSRVVNKSFCYQTAYELHTY